jgi:uncharacterized protein (TIGR02246 family)
MGRKLLMPAFVGMTILLFACDRVASHDESESDPAADADAVRKVEQETLAAFKAKDGNKLAGLYAADAVVASPGHAQAEGAEAIRKAFEGDFADPAFTIDFSSDKIEASGDLAYSRGRYTVGYTNPETKKAEQGKGSYLTAFRRQADGSWKIVADVIHAGG